MVGGGRGGGAGAGKGFKRMSLRKKGIREEKEKEGCERVGKGREV